MQHKKRGRPRLREEESLRGLAFGPEYPTEELYEVQAGGLPIGHPGRHRSKTYRELRSQPEAPYLGQRPSTSDASFPQHQYLQAAGSEYSISAQPGGFPSEYTPTALLTSDFMVVQHNRALSDALSLSLTAKGQTLLDLVVPAEKERIKSLQSSMRAELREACHSSPSHLHGGQSLHASIPAIEQLDIGHATAGFRTRSEYWTFRLPREQSRGFPISISLAKNGGHFVVLTLVQSTPTLQSPPLQHGFQSPTNPGFQSPTVPSFTAPPPKSSHHSSHHQPYHHHHRNSSSTATIPYLISSASSTLDDQLLQMQQPSQSLAQNKRTSPSRPIHPLPYKAARTDSSSLGATSSLAGDIIPRTSPGHQNQPISQDNLRYLQLPPIRTTPTSDPSIAAICSPKERRRLQSGTPSPGRSSPHGGKPRKKRRVEVADMLR